MIGSDVELRYCPTCKEILFVWNDLIIEYCTEERFVSSNGNYIDYGDVDKYDGKKESEECKKGHEGITEIIISYESFKKIFDKKKEGIAINLPEEYYRTEISDEDFNIILLESGVSSLGKK